ncbi:MAG: DEAD/DEAH box helicase [Actinomycetota bacterium]
MSSLTAVQETTFKDLGLHPDLIRTLNNQGITVPFPIQEATIPDAIAGCDILGRGQTGSGKTLAFGLALLHNIYGKRAKPHQPLALVLAPTRELAQQIDEVLHPLARSIGHDSVVIAGGMPYGKQVNALKKATSILVATPGRLIDLLEKDEVSFEALQITVLDEADQMADMGFLPVVKQILNQTKKGSQRMLFSATLDRGVDGLVNQYLNNPKSHSIKEIEGTKAKSDHYVFVLDHAHKSDISNQIASREGKSIFFVRTKRGADKLSLNLANAGVKVGTLHGGKSQAVRTRTLARFKDQESAVLVATDVAARGIHVDDIDLVVHFDTPADHKDYLHRSGRTARAGKTGRVVTLATHKEQRTVGGITRRAGVEPRVMAIKPLDEKLVSITGAKEPSGIPVTEKKEKAPSMPRHKSAKNRAKRARNQNKFNRGGSGRKRSF